MTKGFTLIEVLTIVCIVALLSAIAVPNFYEAEHRSQIATVHNDQKKFMVALETYRIDHRSYPMHWPFTAGSGYIAPAGITGNYNYESWIATGHQGTNPFSQLPSFASRNQKGGAVGLTTPVSYLVQYPEDPFGYTNDVTYLYVAGPNDYLLWSPGTDGIDQLDGYTFNHNAAEYIVRGNQPLPSQYLITGPVGNAPKPLGAPTSGQSFTYDPTNGVGSSGDLWSTNKGPYIP